MAEKKKAVSKKDPRLTRAGAAGAETTILDNIPQ
jgi:hypothetical protein